MSLIVDLDAIDAKRTYLQTVSRPMQMAHWLALPTERCFQRTLTQRFDALSAEHRRLMDIIMASPAQR
jgi:hypothetical protein